MSLFPGGSEWRKWDLHVHLPGTKLSDGYAPRDGAPDWDRFCTVLEESDVAVFGITDYFSLTETLGFIQHFKKKYPVSKKTLLPNLELRLNESVNRDAEEVNVHLSLPGDSRHRDCEQIHVSPQNRTARWRHQEALM